MPTLIGKYIQELYWQWVKLDITDSISGTTVSKLHSKFKSMYEEFSRMKCQPWSESQFKNCTDSEWNWALQYQKFKTIWHSESEIQRKTLCYETEMYCLVLENMSTTDELPT